MKRIIVIALLLVSITSVAYGKGYIFSSEESVNTKIAGGAIRLDKKGVYLVANSSHHPIGIKKVYINKKNGALVIIKDNNDPVVTTSVFPDETLSAKGVTVGLSGGGNISQIIFYQNGKRLKLHYASNYKKIASSKANVWFMSVTHDKSN